MTNHFHITLFGRPVFFNKRGHGDSILTTPKLQSFGDTSDLRHSILHIHNKYPNASIIAIGHSAGWYDTYILVIYKYVQI